MVTTARNKFLLNRLRSLNLFITTYKMKNMKYWKTFLLTMALLTGMTSCEKNYYYNIGKTPETVSDNKSTSSSESKGEDNSNKGSNSDSSGEDGEKDRVIPPSEVLKMSTGEDVEVTGYVVGASKSTSLNSAVYAPPFSTTNNIILADKLYEGTDIPEEQQIYIVLTSPTTDDYRSILNLRDNPELYHKQVKISGIIGKYDKNIALKNIFGFNVIE